MRSPPISSSIRVPVVKRGCVIPPVPITRALRPSAPAVQRVAAPVPGAASVLGSTNQNISVLSAENPAAVTSDEAISAQVAGSGAGAANDTSNKGPCETPPFEAPGVVAP